MSDWSHGYNVSSGYTYGFYRELSPGWLDFIAAIKGLLPPARGASGSFRYLELGCGQGFGLCLLAAAHPAGDFVGIDFNPEHIGHARRLAETAGLTNVRFVEGDFAALAQEWPDALGTFDYVTQHGIYSWVPPAVRAGLVSCIDSATHPGSLVYVSYNAVPGWLGTMPFQHVARKLQLATAQSGPAALQAASKLFEAMETAGSPLFKMQPGLKTRLDALKPQNPSYLVQEYLHDHWQPIWFSQVASELEQAKLAFVGSAHLPEALMPSLLPAAMRDLVLAQEDPSLRQDVMDCMINQGFRRDVFCRGPLRSFSSGSHTPAMQVNLVLAAPPTGDVKVSTTVGEAKVAPNIVAPVVEELAKGPRTIAQLTSLPQLQTEANAPIAIQAIILLVHAGVLMLAPADSAPADAAHRLNRTIAAAVANGAPYQYLSSPVLGTAIQTNDVDLILLDAWIANTAIDTAGLGKALVDCLAKLGRGLNSNGSALTGDALALRVAELSESFLKTKLPRWVGLGIVTA